MRGIYHFCPQCHFDVADYLIQSSELDDVASKYNKKKEICHKITQILLGIIGIGVAMLFFILKFILDDNLELFAIIISFVFLIGLFFYFLGVKCPVCGNVNASGNDKYCTNCGIKLE